MVQKNFWQVPYQFRNIFVSPQDKRKKSSGKFIALLKNLAAHKQINTLPSQNPQRQEESHPIDFLVRIKAQYFTSRHWSEFEATGVLIAKNLVLTCAHVVFPKIKSIGERKTVSFSEVQLTSGKIVKVKGFIFPKQFKAKADKSYDYTLLFLEQDVQLEKYPVLSSGHQGKVEVVMMKLRTDSNHRYQVKKQKIMTDIKKGINFLSALEVQNTENGCPLFIEENGVYNIVGLYQGRYIVKYDHLISYRCFFLTQQSVLNLTNFQVKLRKKDLDVEEQLFFCEQQRREKEQPPICMSAEKSDPTSAEQKCSQRIEDIRQYLQGNYGVDQDYYKACIKPWNYYPFNCICLIEAQYNLGKDKKGRIMGVGTLLTSQQLLTCAHLLYHTFILNNTTVNAKADRVYVYIGSEKIQASDYRFPPEYEGGNIKKNRKYDFALLNIPIQIKRDKYPILSQNYESLEPVNIMLGIVREEPSKQSPQPETKKYSVISQKRLLDVSNDELFVHRIPTERGDSGAPLIGHQDLIIAIHASSTYRDNPFGTPVFVANLAVKITDRVIKQLCQMQQQMFKGQLWSHLAINTLNYDNLDKELHMSQEKPIVSIQPTIPTIKNTDEYLQKEYDPVVGKVDAQAFLSLKQKFKANRSEYQQKQITKQESHIFRYLRCRFIMFCNYPEQQQRLNIIKRFVFGWQCPSLLNSNGSVPAGEHESVPIAGRVLTVMKRGEQQSKGQFIKWDSLMSRLRYAHKQLSIASLLLLPELINSQKELQDMYEQIGLRRKSSIVELTLWKQGLQTIRQAVGYRQNAEKQMENIIPTMMSQAEAQLSKIYGFVEQIEVEVESWEQLLRTFLFFFDQPIASGQEMSFVIPKKKIVEEVHGKRYYIQIRYIKLQIHQTFGQYFRKLEGGIVQYLALMKKVLTFIDNLHKNNLILGVHLDACMLVNINTTSPVFYYIGQRASSLKFNINRMTQFQKDIWKSHYPVQQIINLDDDELEDADRASKIDICIVGKSFEDILRDKPFYIPQETAEDLKDLIKSMTDPPHYPSIPTLLHKIDQLLTQMYSSY